MSRISRVPNAEPSFNIYELLFMKPNLLVNRVLKNDAQIARCTLSQNLFAKAWQLRNISANLPLQKQSHIHKLSNQTQVNLKRLSAYNLSKLCYLIARCTRPFQASYSQHIQMVTTIQELFSNKIMLIAYWRKVETHSQGVKYKLFISLRYKSFFHSKIQNTHSNIIYVYIVQNANCAY